uniref:tripartite motif-containing protein 16-like n=1 Tax=Solea senegalensis TaxID=28829 RepID=UPI001CD89EB4|nr:tripartite motif-containing protein 16-like [Solea senegalensis]
MAQGGNQVDRERFCCSICLDLLKDPVTVLCGHSFCMNCIKSHWDGEGEKMIYSCPLCRETFRPRPKLMKSTMLADLVEELKKTEVHDASADHCSAGAEDVACDVCTDRKLKALKSCLVCLVSYCEEHLQPHYQSPAFKKHKLVEPSKDLQDNICPRHNMVMGMFCRTDQQCICRLCSVEEHKDHNTVLAAVERMQKQRELELSLQRLRDSKSMQMLTKELRAIDLSADKAVKDSEKIISELIRLLQERKSEVNQQIRFQQKTEVSRVRVLQMKLQQEITVLNWREAELKPLLNSEDHTQFLLTYLSVPALSPSTYWSSIHIQPRRYFEEVTSAVAKVRDQVQHVLTETQSDVPRTETKVDVSLSQPQPETKEDFLRYSQAITLDPNTANTCLVLSEGNRTVAAVWEAQPYRHHRHRFTHLCQVLSRESMTGRCYWEVKWTGRGLCVALTYKNIGRSGRSGEFVLGNNDNSWALDCSNNCCEFFHKGIKTKVSSGLSCKIGVYLDHSAGILCFYRVSDTMTLLHRVHTTFTLPLHAGVRLNFPGTVAEFC